MPSDIMRPSAAFFSFLPFAQVLYNGSPVMDIYARAGGKNSGYVVAAYRVASASSLLRIQWTSTIENAKLSGIEICACAFDPATTPLPIAAPTPVPTPAPTTPVPTAGPITGGLIWKVAISGNKFVYAGTVR